MESLSSVMKVRPQKPDHHQELKVTTSSTKKVSEVKSETKKNSEVSKIADLRMTHLDGVYRSCSYFVATLLLRTRKQLMIHI